LNLRVLHIEDDLVDQKVFAKIACILDVDLSVASSFDEAIALLQTQVYDYIFCDANVGPDYVLEYIDQLPSTNFFILTNNTKLAGLDEYKTFEKPMSLESLSSLLSKNEKDQLSLEQVISLCEGNPSEMKELYLLMIDDFEQCLGILNSNKTIDIANGIHKVLSKLSFIGLNASRAKFLTFEKKLRNDLVLEETEISFSKQQLELGIAFLKKQIV